jgi:dual specificity tyrosine-phosphorylation-regulated kinase 2/3/4
MKIDEASPAHYCNDAGSYISHIGDHLFYRYEIIQAVGTGSFGDVYECFDYKDSKHVAIKIIKNKAKYLANALEEKRMLELIHSTKEDSSATGEEDSSSPKSSSSTCIVELLHHFEFRSHHCFVFPRYGKNLFEFLQQRDFTGLPISFIKKVAVQLLNALVHLHQLGIVHCDLKPENILIRDEKQCSVVLIDFGNSCLASETPLTYIQSRFYRSPEVLFGLPYGMQVLMSALLSYYLSLI